jgi:MerR family transcriptional regulator, light-induced transcriptional regulator
MGKYAIKDLEKLSGIKAHTIRIWEKRHHLITPQRTDTNIRFYDDRDLKKIINVATLNASGIKISKIAGMSDEEINQKVISLTQNETEANIHIDQLVITMVELDEEKFEKALSGLVLRLGFERAVREIIYPFLEKIGILWQTQNVSPAQEHFISNLIRQKVIVAIDALPLPPQTAKKVMLFLPEGELHEIGLLFANYLVRSAGYRSYYLGQSVPYADLVSIYNVHKPDIMITAFISAIPKKSVDQYLTNLVRDLSGSTILVTGYQVMAYHFDHPKVHILRKITELSSHI